MDAKNQHYFDVNRTHWNERTKVHVDSEFYDNASFKQGRNSINTIELPYVKDITGKRVLHLQCHFGQDSISLKRMGAASVTGVDFSEEAIQVAKKLAVETNTEVQFILGNVLDIDQFITGEYDLIFCSYGVTGWLPQLDGWAKNVSTFLAPGGRFVYAEFHPAMWMFDDKMEKVTYPYLHGDVISEEEEGTYTDGGEDMRYTMYGWNYGISEVITPLLDNELQLKTFKEFDHSPYECWPNMIRTENGLQIKGMEGMLPMVYLIEMVKPG